MKRVAVIIPVGPGGKELRRFRDLLDSLWHYEPGASLCIAIDSSPYARNLAPHDKRSCRFVTLQAPFRGQGEPLKGRLSAGLLQGYEIIRRAGPFDFVLRADTDALITNRFRETLSEFFRRHPRTGMLGTLGHTCRRDSPHYGCEKTSVSDVVTELATLPRDDAAFARLTVYLNAAVMNGYVGKEYCQGGIYALPFRTLEQMSEQGCFRHPEDWVPLGVPEDVMMGMLTRAAGLECTDFSQCGEPFGSNYCGLAYSPDEILDRGHALIHSVKSDPAYSEPFLRRFFRNVRDSQSQAQTSGRRKYRSSARSVAASV